MVHLARRGRLLRVGRWLRRRDIRWNWWRKILWNTGRSAGRQRTDVSARRRIALHQLDHYQSPARMAGQVLPKPTRETLSSRKSTPNVTSIAGPNELAGAAAFALARSRTAADHSHCLANSQTPRKIRMSGQKRSRPNSKSPGSVHRKSTPRPIRRWQLRQEPGAFEFLAGAKGLCQADMGQGQGSPAGLPWRCEPSQ